LGMASGRRFSCRVLEIASGFLCLRAKAQRGGSKFNKYFNDFSHPFLFKSASMNPLFEQDPDYPYFGSSEERTAFYSAKLSRSDDQPSGSAPTSASGGPIRKARRSKVVLKMQYSKQCKKILESMSNRKNSTMSDSDDDVPIFGEKPTTGMSDSDDDVPIFPKKPTAEGSDDDDVPIFDFRDPPAVAVNINVRAQIERIRQGASKVRLLRPLPEANLATDVEMLVRACIDHLHVTSLDLSVSHPPMQALHSGWK